MTAHSDFLDYYYDLFTYLEERKQRLEEFKEDVKMLPPELRTKEWKYYSGKERAYLRKRRTRTRLANFHIITQVGQGGYGQVYLARKKDSNELCALKKMSKKLLQRLGEVQHILTERDILTRTQSPWLVKLLYAFQDIENVYLAMEYVPGGDMRTLLNNSGVLREEHARFYVAEMFMSIAALHALGYIHRQVGPDLKPENFLIDAGGHIKLTDFGLSRGNLSPEIIDSMRLKLNKVKETPFVQRSIKERWNIHKTVKREAMRAFSLVGSPDYMAPEVLANNNQGYGLAVDYWSVGCIMFECLSGFPPFTAPTTDDVWVNVYHWQRVLERPVYTGVDEEFNLTDDAWDLITRLLTLAAQRYTTPDQVESHPFFRGHKMLLPGTTMSVPFQFRHLRGTGSASITPPFVPRLASELDTSYFDDFSNPSDMAMYKEVKERQRALESKMSAPGGKGAAGGQEDSDVRELRSAFIGFTFRHSDMKNWGERDVQVRGPASLF
ncbi:kinase-like domain-containing protein [Polychytrium aggregatum]|uniref:kinase-like domain-containing protein n=1 Tax=Polychytrium aggregatum TaxID=110093 RepID=UPI0022FEFD4B|nr:kinase-like domain-containing protein [Polychytrium aggregatum]KAI9202119.1 kinase-like domain-containing protein [Polychytrium aggregatum]